MAMSDEEKAARAEERKEAKVAEHANEVAEQDAEELARQQEAIAKGKVEVGVVMRAADPKVGGESFDYGEVDYAAREEVLGEPAPKEDGQRDPADDFNYGAVPVKARAENGF